MGGDQLQVWGILKPSQSHRLLGSMTKGHPVQDSLLQLFLWQSVMNNIPYSIFWKDIDSIYQGCNSNWAEIVGLSDPQAIVGKTDHDFCWSQEQADIYRKLDQEVMNTRVPQINLLTSRLHVNGEQLWFRGLKIPLSGAEGQIIGIICLFENIRDHQRAGELGQSTKLMQLVLDNIPQSLFWKDRELVYLGCNRNWATAAGIPNLADVVGKTDFDLIWREEAALYRAQDRWVMETDTPILHLIEHRLNADGQQTWIDVNKIPIHDSEGGVVGILGTIEDITERKQAEIALQQSEAQLRQKTEQLEQALRELQQAQAQLVQTEKMSSLGQLVAGVAHEINNPVNFIYGNITHADHHIQDLLHLIQVYQTHYPRPVPEVQTEIDAIDLNFVLEDLPKILSSIKLGSERIKSIVLALRNFSRMDESEVKTVDIHEGIDSTLMILNSRLKSKSSPLEIQIIKNYGDLPLVECYAGQLNQVFMNILSNALDTIEEVEESRKTLHGFRPFSPPMIQIQTKRCGLDRVAIRIRDNGAGMTEEVQNRLFDPFFTTKPVGQGTGLGLSISYQIIVERHKGLLQCFSEPGAGTEFRIEVPVAQG